MSSYAVVEFMEERLVGVVAEVLIETCDGVGN